MLFLALAIFGSVFTASFIKWCESRKIDTVGVIASNYLSGSLLGWALVGWDGWPGLSAETVGFGIGGGMLWPSAFLVFRWGIHRYGLSLSISAANLCSLRSRHLRPLFPRGSPEPRRSAWAGIHDYSLVDDPA